jgi:hypothetical protein
VYNAKSIKNFKKLFLPKEIKDLLFQWYIYGASDSACYTFNEENLVYTDTIEDLQQIYKSKQIEIKNGIDIFKFNTINKVGSIQPLQRWLINCFIV